MNYQAGRSEGWGAKRTVARTIEVISDKNGNTKRCCCAMSCVKTDSHFVNVLVHFQIIETAMAYSPVLLFFMFLFFIFLGRLVESRLECLSFWKLLECQVTQCLCYKARVALETNISNV